MNGEFTTMNGCNGLMSGKWKESRLLQFDSRVVRKKT